MTRSKTSPPSSAFGFHLVGAEQVRLTGTLLGEGAQAELAKQFANIHERIAREKIKRFTVDVRGLAFVNSSAIRVFVDWTSRAEASGYKLIFLTDDSITWHRLSFSVLKSLAPDTVDIVASASGGSPQ